MKELHDSIKYWQNILEQLVKNYVTNYDIKYNIHTGPSDCSLCQVYFNNWCIDCPVFNKTKQNSCIDTPYHDFRYALNNFNFKLAISECINEIEFLKSLL